MRCPTCSRDQSLTPRESDVLELVLKGLTNKEIASQLFVEEKTIKCHKTEILKKKGAKRRTDLMYAEAVRRIKARKR